MICASARERAHSRPWHTDWLVLRGLSRLVREDVGKLLQHGSKVVDVGCGDMPYRHSIQNLGLNYFGADLNKTADILIDDMGNVDLPDDSANAILSVQVLEHVLDLDKYFYEIKRLLTHDGILFLSTHGTWLYHPHPEDHRRWTRTGLVADLESRGFKVHELKALVGPLATTTIIRLTGYAFMLRKIPAIGGMLASTLALAMNLRAMLEDVITPADMRMNNACIYWVIARPI